jgi:hypothetical protein
MQWQRSTDDAEPRPPSEGQQPSLAPAGLASRETTLEAPTAHGSEEQVVAHPSRVVRLAAMTQGLLLEIQHVELDDAARHRLAAVFNRTVQALKELLSSDLQHELDRLELRLPDDPTDAELRVAQAQLVGWLEGLFHGIRTTVIANQLATQEEMARSQQHGLETAQQQRASSYL